LEFDNRYQDLTTVSSADFLEERIESQEMNAGIKELLRRNGSAETHA